MSIHDSERQPVNDIPAVGPFVPGQRNEYGFTNANVDGRERPQSVYLRDDGSRVDGPVAVADPDVRTEWAGP